MTDLDRAADALKSAARVAVLTGAGVSAESGVPTFRAADGLWEGHRIDDVATPTGFARDPQLVWRFYNARRSNVAAVLPNPGHRALAALEATWGSENFTLVTQNVDGLHQACGSRNVLEVHGSLRRTRCLGCRLIEVRGLEPLGDEPHCPKCGDRLRPDIVWFNEGLPEDVWHSSQVAAARCDVFLVVGTSAVVYPAAGLVPLARQSGATVIEVNLVPSEASEYVAIGLYGPSGVTLPALCDRLGIPVPA